MVKSKEKYLPGTYEELELINQDMIKRTGQTLKQYIWTRVIETWVEQSPSFDDEFLNIPSRIARNMGHYRVRITYCDKRVNFGSYSKRCDAEKVVEYIDFKEANGELDELVNNMKHLKPHSKILDVIDADAEYSDYLRQQQEEED